MLRQRQCDWSWLILNSWTKLGTSLQTKHFNDGDNPPNLWPWCLLALSAFAHSKPVVDRRFFTRGPCLDNSLVRGSTWHKALASSRLFVPSSNLSFHFHKWIILHLNSGRNCEIFFFAADLPTAGVAYDWWYFNGLFFFNILITNYCSK